MAVLPTELENVPDDFLHQLKGLLDLGLNQGGEVNYSHVNLQREEIQTGGVSTDLKTKLQRVCSWECGERKWQKKSSQV